MGEIEERTKAQLMVIEQSYSIDIQNKEEIACLIAEKVDDKRKVLMICTSINYWIAGNDLQGRVVIPRDLVLRLLKTVH